MYRLLPVDSPKHINTGWKDSAAFTRCAKLFPIPRTKTVCSHRLWLEVECPTFQRWLQGLRNLGNHSWCVEIRHLTSCWTILKPTRCSLHIAVWREGSGRRGLCVTQRRRGIASGGGNLEVNCWHNLVRLFWADLQIVVIIIIINILFYIIIIICILFYILLLLITIIIVVIFTSNQGIFTPGKFSFSKLQIPQFFLCSTEEKRHNSTQSTYFRWQLCGVVKFVNLQKDLSLLERSPRDRAGSPVISMDFNW